MTTIRPGTRYERKNGKFWREVCTCGWIGRWWRGHLNMVRRMYPFSDEAEKHRLERYGWYADEAATRPPERSG